MATVKAGDVSTTTVSDGSYTITTYVDQYSGPPAVQITKSGYFSFTGAPLVGSDGAAVVNARLVPKKKLGTIDSTTGGTVSDSNVSVAAPPNAFVSNGSGNQYNGTVAIYAGYISPEDAHFAGKTSGGNFGAQDSNDTSGTLLQSFGGLVIETDSSSGEAIYPFSKLTISVPIPSDVLSSAPGSLPAWELDGAGTWKEAGTCSKTGSGYTLEVSGSGLIDCDTFNEAATLSGYVYVHGHLSPNVEVKVGESTAISDSNGEYSIPVPLAKVFTISWAGSTQKVGPLPKYAEGGLNL